MEKTFILVLFLFSLPAVSADLIINEIMYNPSGADADHEWVEVYNNDENINLEDWRFFEANTPHRLSLVQGDDMIISEGEYVVIADNAEIFLQGYENFQGTVLDSTFSLSNTGEYIALKDPDGNIVDEVDYSSDWGSIEGKSLELMNPVLDNNEGANWNSSLEESGTPGEINSIFMAIAEELRFNQEIQLSYGWNLVSSYIIPISAEIVDVFSPLVESGSLQMVKDSQGRFYNPRTGFNNIPEWNPDEAYLVKISRLSATMAIYGNEMADTQVNLNPRWNYVSYPVNSTHSADEVIENVFDSLDDNLIMVKDGFGKFYVPRNNFNNIQEFAPGRGYQVKVNEEAVLDFSSLS